MNVAEAKEMVLALMSAGQPEAARLMVDPVPPDNDQGKIRIDGKIARVIHRFSGWHVPISLAWFTGGYDATAQIGGALGLAVLATVSASRSSTLLAQHHPAAAALTGGYHLAFWIACGLVITATGIAATMLHHQPTVPLSPQPVRELVHAGQAH